MMRRPAVVLATRADRSVDLLLDAHCERCERGCRRGCAALFGGDAPALSLTLPPEAVDGDARVGARALVEPAGGLYALARRGPGRLLAGTALGALAGHGLAVLAALAPDLAVAAGAAAGFSLAAATLGGASRTPPLRARILLEPTSHHR